MTGKLHDTPACCAKPDRATRTTMGHPQVHCERDGGDFGVPGTAKPAPPIMVSTVAF